MSLMPAPQPISIVLISRDNAFIFDYLELDNFPCVPEFWKNVVVELQKLLPHLVLAVLETCVCIVIIASTLLHGECHKHTPDHQSAA